MRTIKSILAILAISLSLSANSQKVSTNVGASFLAPVHNLNQVTFGTGVDVSNAYNLGKDWSVVLNASYNWFDFEKSNTGNLQVLPVKMGLKFNTSPKVYVQGDAGVAFFTKAGTRSFAFSGRVGYQTSRKVDISARYEGWSKNDIGAGFVGVRFGYSL